MRFFGHLICLYTLGHFIFESRLLDNLFRNKLTEFSEHIHNFGFHKTEDISDINCPENDDEDLDNDIDTARLTSSSIKQYWQKELADMKTNAVDEQAGHELNKYFMPKYFGCAVNNWCTGVFYGHVCFSEIYEGIVLFTTQNAAQHPQQTPGVT